MTKVFCAAFDCKHCHDGRCDRKEVHLNRGCQDYEESDSRKLAMRLLGGNVRGSDQKWRMV